MKHTWKITAILLMTFLMAQFMGILILYNYIDVEKSAEEGRTIFGELPIGERPPLEEKTSFLPVIIAILVGTGLVLLLLKYNLIWLWKFWFFLAVVFALGIAFAAFLKPAHRQLLHWAADLHEAGLSISHSHYQEHPYRSRYWNNWHFSYLREPALEQLQIAATL